MPNPKKYKKQWDLFRLGKMQSFEAFYEHLEMAKYRKEPTHVLSQRELRDFGDIRGTSAYWVETIDPPMRFLCQVCYWEPESGQCRDCSNYKNFVEHTGGL